MNLRSYPHFTKMVNIIIICTYNWHGHIAILHLKPEGILNLRIWNHNSNNSLVGNNNTITYIS